MIIFLIKIFLWLLAFVPLIVDQSVFFPFISGKSIFMQSCVGVAGLLLISNYFYSVDFRNEINTKVARYIRSPLSVSILSFSLILIVSTFFSVDKYMAFWGELGRAEGLSAMIFYFSFFVFSLLIFEKKDWILFLKISLFTTLIILSREFIEYFYEGVTRPGSYTGNPIFLAGYLLFSIMSASVLLTEKRDGFWKYSSVLILILSVVGIFITQTRGAILGLGLGTVLALLIIAINGEVLKHRKFDFQKVSIVILCCLIVLSLSFVFTRQNSIWQKVPGLSRFAITRTADGYDPSTQIRLYIYKSSIDAINPAQNGWAKFLIGWGPDNFSIAQSRYYNAEQYKYEQTWYDRAHNKILDVLVMNGILGLIFYFLIWISFFILIIKHRPFTSLNISLLFFGVSFFTYLMFIFDQISTWIPFFLILAFTVQLTTKEAVSESRKSPESQVKLGTAKVLNGGLLVSLVLCMLIVLVRNTIPAYIQMRSFSDLMQNTKAANFETKIDSVFSPFTTAQMNIRLKFLDRINDINKKSPTEASARLLDKALIKADEYIQKRPLDLSFSAAFAHFYTQKGKFLKRTDYLKRGEELLNKVLLYTPNRPDVNHKLAYNLIYQKRYIEAYNIYERILESNSIVLEAKIAEFESIYTTLIKYFYQEQDEVNFTKVANRLKANNYADSASLDDILNYLNINGTWPKIDFE